MAANEIRKGTFVYRDTFFADPGGDKRHPRASISELKDLLLPKKGCAPPKDQVAHWYEAQLLHYGLPRSKDKNTAKVRLTSAITAGNLAIPASIVQMEADMKKEFATANRKAKATMKAKQADSLTEPASKSKKRKADFDGDSTLPATTTKISVKVGNVAFDIDHHEGSPHSKKQKATPRATEPKAPKNTPKTETKSAKVPKKSTTSSKLPEKTTVSKTAQPSSRAKAVDAPKPKQTARRTWRSSWNIGHEEPTSKWQQAPEDYIEMNDAPPPYELLDSYNSDRDAVRIQVSGVYTISSSFNDMDCELTLVKDSRTGQFWGEFVAAGHRGVLHIPRAEGLVTKKAVEFNWRASDEGSGQLRFKRDQNGWIQVDGQGGVRGCWNGLFFGDDVEFTGFLDEEPDVEVDNLIDQWEWFVKSAYGR